MTNKEIEELFEEELEDFYTAKEESDKKFKLLLEFDSSVYDYNGIDFIIPVNKIKKNVKGKEIDLSKQRNKGNKLF